MAQNIRLIDSIRYHLRTAEGKERFDLLNDLAWEHRFANPDSTILYSNRAYSIGKKLKLEEGLARPLNILGVAYNYKGERILAYENYTNALQLAVFQTDSVQIAHANNNMGRLFFEQGMLSRSYEYLINARSIFQAINDSSGLAYVYQSLGNIYKTQRDYRKSEDNFLKAYRIRLKLGNTRDVMSALLYLGRMYQDWQNWDKSIRYLKLADSTGNAIHDEINVAEIKTYLAESYLHKGMLSEAEAIGQEGLNVITRMDIARMKPQAFQIMGQIFIRKNDLNAARKLFLESLKISTDIKEINGQMRAYFHLWKVAEAQRHETEILKNLTQYLLLKDSVKDLDLARQVERFQFEIEIQRKEQENEILKAKAAENQAVIKQQKLENIVLIAIVVFVSVLGFMQWRNSNKRNEINKQLTAKNQEIEKHREEISKQNEKLARRNQQLSDLNHEKDTLMNIVANDLKSALNRINSILNAMHATHLTEEQQGYASMSREATQTGLDLIKDLLDVHMLEENTEPRYTRVDLSKFLLQKMETFTSAAEVKDIHLYITRVTNDEVYTDLDYLNRIVDQLISNAIKFSERNSTVVIAAGKLVDEFWISVKDQGPGFSGSDKQQLYQRFRKLSAQPTGGEPSKGLGLAIVKTLVDRLKGKVELATEPEKGSQFTIRIPSLKTEMSRKGEPHIKPLA